MEENLDGSGVCVGFQQIADHDDRYRHESWPLARNLFRHFLERRLNQATRRRTLRV
jgi:hypothetical protein